MLPEMTPAVARALDDASALAHAEGADELRPAHLLHALLSETEGKAYLLATRAGLDERTHQESAPQVPEPDEATPTAPLSNAVRLALATARRTSIAQFGETSVTGEAVLVSLLREDESVRSYATSLGMSLERLEEVLRIEAPPPIHLEEPLELNEWTEQVDLSRILDAAANRAREGLRVVEDYCRFAMDDTFLTNECKQLRHALQTALSGFRLHTFLQSRETQRDVGTPLTTTTEQQRFSLQSTVQTNLKRLQESLRSLEEFGKQHSPEVGSQIETIRYRSYTLERAILLTTAARERLADVRLYLLVGSSQCHFPLQRTIEESIAGGVQMVQLREKDLDDRDLLRRAREVREWTARAGVLFLVNDRPDIARLVEADGVHVGQNDLPVKEARRILGPDAIVGVSTHTMDQVRQAVLDGATYIGVGPTFPSQTKAFTELAGLDFVRQACAETTLPSYAIGGINSKSLDAVLAAGASRVAVSHALAGSEDPRALAVAFLQKLE